MREAFAIPVFAFIAFFAYAGQRDKAEYYQGADGVLLPDPKVTPGKVDPRVHQQNIARTICQHNYTARVRYVTDATKKQVLEAYGVDPRTSAQYEIDHLVSLEIGGANDISNLWPQPYETDAQGVALGAHAKDKLENWLHRQVCSGSMKLKEAQALISHNWYIAYQEMQKQERQ